MVFAFSNLIMLLPIACVLAIMLSMTGSTILRPRDDSVRVFVQIIIWQFALIGTIGLLARSSWLSLLWLLFALAFLLQLWFWERGLVRNMLLLVFGASSASPAQINKVLHYLNLEGRGYWRRLGRRFGLVWQATGNWQLALLRVRLVRPVRARVALASLANQHDTEHFNQQITQAAQEQKLASQWLGRLVAVSLSFLVLFASGLFYENVTHRLLERAWQEHAKVGIYPLPRAQAWQNFVDWKLHIIIPVLVWLTILTLYVFKKFPSVARRRPVVWLFRGYYRSLTVEGLAHGLKSCQDPIRVCEQLAEVIAVPTWSRKLRYAAGKLSQGLSLPNALASSGLLRRNEAATLALCRDADSVAWAMHELSQSLLERAMSRTHVAVQLLTVGLTLFAAIVTTWYALATFGALAALMESQA